MGACVNLRRTRHGFTLVKRSMVIVMIILLGLMVGFIFFGLYLPLVNLIQNLT